MDNMNTLPNPDVETAYAAVKHVEYRVGESEEQLRKLGRRMADQRVLDMELPLAHIAVFASGDAQEIRGFIGETSGMFDNAIEGELALTTPCVKAFAARCRELLSEA